jgi:DNA-binding winged helix-turn-helix (wHTH) protein
MNAQDMTLGKLMTRIEKKLTPRDKKILTVLMTYPEGRTRQQMVKHVYDRAVKDVAGSTEDREIRRRIFEMRMIGIPIFSTSHRAGYKLDATKEGAALMAKEFSSRAKKALDVAKATRKMWLLPAQEVAIQERLV